MAKISYDTEVQTLSGETGDLSKYQGSVMLVVNTASKCGLTPHFKGLEELHQAYSGRGLAVLGFPSNSFRQENAADEDIAEVCHINYGVTFDMHAKTPVNGRGTHPLFRELKAGARGFGGLTPITWNFTKFLVARDGTILKRFGPRTDPRDLTEDIEAALAT